MSKKIKTTCFDPVFLTKENEINKLIRSQKKTGEKTYILFVSDWDEFCTNLVTSIRKKVAKISGQKVPLYIINSFDTPHSFVIYSVKKAPTLVVLDRSEVYKEEYTPNIWYKLSL